MVTPLPHQEPPTVRYPFQPEPYHPLPIAEVSRLCCHDGSPSPPNPHTRIYCPFYGFRGIFLNFSNHTLLPKGLSQTGPRADSHQQLI